MAIRINNMSDLVREFKRGIKDNKYAAKVSEKELADAAYILKRRIMTYIRFYFDNYRPVMWGAKDPENHERHTRRFENSVLTEVSGTRARVYFDDSQVYRNSIFGGNQGYLPALLNDGWKVVKGKHKDIHHFGYFEGARFIEAAIMEARKDFRFKHIEIIPVPDRVVGSY